MNVYKAGTRPTIKASADYFIGDVWQDPVITAPEPARVRALVVTFAPGARTAWHTHPLGQTLHVLSGVGRVALRGAPPRVIQAGDTVWIPPLAEHWHGAGPDTKMVHMAMQEELDGTMATWLEQVSDDDFLKPPE